MKKEDKDNLYTNTVILIVFIITLCLVTYICVQGLKDDNSDVLNESNIETDETFTNETILTNEELLELSAIGQYNYTRIVRN